MSTMEEHAAQVRRQARNLFSRQRVQEMVAEHRVLHRGRPYDAARSSLDLVQVNTSEKLATFVPERGSKQTLRSVQKRRCILDYQLLEAQLRALISEERDELANMANFAAFVYHEVPDLNWAGFYFVDEAGELVLGPFHGRPACTRLPAGRGVCGAACSSGETTVVDDVNAFAEHIVCDSASASEIVVPLRDETGAIYGVFDVDSPRLARFAPEDARGIERLVSALLERVPSRPSFLVRLVR